METKEKEAKTSNQRTRILYLLKILLDLTDEQHSLTMKEIISELEKYGITAERKAIYADIEALRQFGLDIISSKGNSSSYYLASRDFELPELKLLADAVSSARFLTEKKSAALIKKISKLASVHEGKQIQRQVYVANRVKSGNERIYLNVDVISRAIDEGKQISFKYFDYDLQKKKRYRGETRTCHPYALSWDGEHYYLIAFYDKYNDISSFRVDRMENAEILPEKVKPKPKDFDAAKYVNSTFSMFSGSEQTVKLRFANEFINAVTDRFGSNVRINIEDNEYFSVDVKVRPTPTFFAWLCQFEGKASIIAPSDVKEKYIKQLRQALEAADG